MYTFLEKKNGTKTTSPNKPLSPNPPASCFGHFPYLLMMWFISIVSDKRRALAKGKRARKNAGQISKGKVFCEHTSSVYVCKSKRVVNALDKKINLPHRVSDGLSDKPYWWRFTERIGRASYNVLKRESIYNRELCTYGIQPKNRGNAPKNHGNWPINRGKPCIVLLLHLPLFL